MLSDPSVRLAQGMSWSSFILTTTPMTSYLNIVSAMIPSQTYNTSILFVNPVNAIATPKSYDTSILQ